VREARHRAKDRKLEEVLERGSGAGEIEGGGVEMVVEREDGLVSAAGSMSAS